MSGITNFRPQGGGDYVPVEYTATKEATARCGTDKPGTGAAVTRSATRTSPNSQVEADSLAYTAALQEATAALVCTVSYGYTLIGPEDEGEGVTLRSGGAHELSLDALPAGDSLPVTMSLTIGGTQVASVVLLARYVGKPFTFRAGGTLYAGVFTSGSVAL